ncbi:RNA pseudouridine synthase [Phragmitibacter flavus]|uniref:RNA pseudouridine synthase n=1 Tax=Phragmitibacter flavus TaxID=2576071 RepID=A0A5R8KDS8_9BACT|nr:RNA pseudouridine synthase [Phragmitibacter flavus]TLD70458.1 RNA pseudouridine synthase [Phragmitibacter flavus]
MQRHRFDFTVLDETDTYLVVDKPAPLQIHPSKPRDAGLTLWDGLRHLLCFELSNGGQISIINRLDRETSGLVLVAKTSATARRFGKAMLRRQIHKSYLALVHGWPAWEDLTEMSPILRAGDVQDSPIYVKQIVHENGQACHSEFRVRQRFEHRGEPFALVEATPHSGRMHQLRVHLSHNGHPVVGDKLYGTDETLYLAIVGQGWTAELASKLLMPRQALHSHQLKLEDEYGTLSWSAPLPQDMSDFIIQG